MKVMKMNVSAYESPMMSEMLLMNEGTILSGSTEMFYDEDDPLQTRFGDSWLEC